MSEDIDSRRRKLAARRFNENLKLLVNSINAAALTVFGAALILPAINGVPKIGWGWILVATGLHITARLSLRGLRSEE